LADLKCQEFSGQYKYLLQWHQQSLKYWWIYSVRKFWKAIPDSEQLFRFKRDAILGHRRLVHPSAISVPNF